MTLCVQSNTMHRAQCLHFERVEIVAKQLFADFCEGLFVLSFTTNAAMSLAISLWWNFVDFLINQVSHSKNGLQICNHNWWDMTEALMLTLQINHWSLVQTDLKGEFDQGTYSDWKNGNAFSSQGKVKEFWTDWKSWGK